MAQAPEVVIVDDAGTEHVFPPGFDPARASAIVRRQALVAANQTPLKEPTTYTGGVMRSAGDTVGRTVKGVAEGFGALVDPRTYINALNDAYEYATNPALSAIHMADKGRAMVDEAGRVVSGEPEAGGRAMAQLATMGFAPRVAPAVVDAANAAAPSVGRGMATTGRLTQSMGRKLAPATRFSALTLYKHPAQFAATMVAPDIVQALGRLMEMGGTKLATRGLVSDVPYGPFIEDAPPFSVDLPTVAEMSPLEFSRALRNRAATSPAETVSGGTPPPSDPLPSPTPGAPRAKTPKELNEEAIARRRAAYQARLKAEAQGPEGPAPKPTMTAAEVAEYQRLRQMGKTDQEAQQAIAAARALNAVLSLQTPTASALRFPKGMRGKPQPPREP